MFSAISIGRTRVAYAFLESNPRLTEEENDKMIAVAGRMYFDEQKKKKIHGENYDGFVSLHRAVSGIGAFFGPEYRVEIDHNRFGKATLRFIISEITPDAVRKN